MSEQPPPPPQGGWQPPGGGQPPDQPPPPPPPPAAPPPPPPGPSYQPPPPSGGTYQPPPAPGYGPPAGYSGGAAVVGPPNDSQATLALILGIVGVVCCPLVAPVAFFIGNASRNRIRASGGTLGGSGMATAGWVLGIVGMVFLVIWILLTILSIISSAANRTGG